MTKTIWLGRFFIFAEITNELFYTTGKSGSRSYYLFRIGFNKYKIDGKIITSLMIDVPFVEFGFGKMLSVGGKRKTTKTISS